MTEESTPTSKPSHRSSEIAGNVEIPIVWYHDWVKEHLTKEQATTPEKVAVITGSNSGTGFWCAKALVKTGATVVLACRNVEKATFAKEEILEDHPTAKLDIMELDTSKLSVVRAFATTFTKKYDRLDWLVNNAGVMALEYSQTEDGHEIQWQTNHLGHFLLTKLLWKTIMATPTETRIVQHSSNYHFLGSPKFDKTSMEFPKHGPLAWPVWNILMPLIGQPKHHWSRYGVSKLCNILFMKGLEERINQFEIMKANPDDGKKILSLACHPGYAKTQLQLAAPPEAMGVMKVGTDDGAQSAADGSLPLLMACLGKDVHNGDYFGPEKYMTKGLPMKQKIRGFGNDPEQIQSLWEYSEECIGEKFEVAI